MKEATTSTTQAWWQSVRKHLVPLYIVGALAILGLSVIGHLRLLNQVGSTFGGFFWAIDPDGNVSVVSTPPQSSTFRAFPSSLTNSETIVGVQVESNNGQVLFSWPRGQHHDQGPVPLQAAYQHAQPGDLIRYTIQHNNSQEQTMLPAAQFTFDMWWENYGLALLAGISWLLVGSLLFVTAQEWLGAVEGITLLPPALLFLLYSHWGNVQQDYPSDLVIQLLWIPSFALLGAAFIHLSLAYRPEATSTPRRPRWRTDALPYVLPLALIVFGCISIFVVGKVPGRLLFIVALGYGAIGGLLSFAIGFTSLLRVLRVLPGKHIAPQVGRRLGDLLTLWIGGVGLGFCLGVLPILLIGQPLLPLPVFDTLAIVYPLLLLYAIRSLRLIDRLQATLAQREAALREQQTTAAALQQTNVELQRATSLLLHADAHLRSLLSQRIHDQPKQQAQRIRSLLGYWQRKLQGEAERNPSGKIAAEPVITTLATARQISEELENDLRGLQFLVEDVYQRRSLGLKLHLEKLIREDLPALHPESPLTLAADLEALADISHDLEQSEAGRKVAEAISFTVTQALLNIYNHAEATCASIQTSFTHGMLEVRVRDDGQGFDPAALPPEKISLFKAQLKAREADGALIIQSIAAPQAQHGTTIILRLPCPRESS